MTNKEDSRNTEVKKKKRQSQAPVALVYFITFAIVIVVIGGISLFVMENYVLTDDSSSESVSEDDTPKSSDNETHFYLLVNDSGELEMTMLERFLPKSGKIMLLPLSPLTVNSSGTTIKEVYSSGGATSVKSDVEEVLDITVDNYIVLSHSNFADLIDNLSSISYTVPETMYYVDENSDDVINYEKGETLTLQGSELRLFISYPEYSDGPQENADVTGELLKEVINQGLSSTTTVQTLSSTFSTMVKNSEDKDFSLNDFDDRKKTMINYVVDNSSEPAETIKATGTWSSDNTTFTVDETFVEQLKNLFEL